MDTGSAALAVAVLTGLSVACRAPDHRGGARDTVVAYVAASLTPSFRAIADSFSTGGSVVERESGASLEHARKLTELGRIPDVLALADYEVFPNLLMPRYVEWYAAFARNRMVVAYTGRSAHAREIDSTSWTRILAAPGVRVGRTDPDVAPVGYRTILMLELAEKWYRQPGLAARLLANAPRRNMRADAAQLAALLEAGELDYIYDYESVAVSRGFRYVQLPAAIDLSDPERAAAYAAVTARVRGRKPGDTITVKGQPILYAVSVPEHAPHPDAAVRFTSLLLGPEGRRMLRLAHVDALDRPVFFGSGVPAELRASAAR